MKTLTHGSLFAGIGGFDLGFERAGIKTIWQVEIDEYCRRVLARHFPDAERFGDIRDCCGFSNQAHRKVCDRPFHLPQVDAITGGFPCQPFSTGGRRKGKSDDRFLWPEMLRIVVQLQPKFICIENVSGLVHEFDGVLDQICGDLEAAKYEVIPPLMVPACSFGAPHRRDRVWILAYSMRGFVSSEYAKQQARWPEVFKGGMWWDSEPRVGRVANGVSNRLAERALGNSAVPQIAEWIGRRIVECANEVS